MDNHGDETRNAVASGYDELAVRDHDRDGSPWGDSHYQQHYAWPTTQRVLPDVNDSHVLLAGCGRGDHADWFLERGAEVVGVDASESAITIAHDTHGSSASFQQADVTDGLPMLESGSFDLVVSNLVFGHLDEWTPVLETFDRLLVERGTVVVTTVHPSYVRRNHDIDSYYDKQRVVVDWPGGAKIPTHYRPMEDVVNSFADAGYHIDKFREPRPEPSYSDVRPNRYQDAIRDPQVLCIRATPDETDGR